MWTTAAASLARAEQPHAADCFGRPRRFTADPQLSFELAGSCRTVQPRRGSLRVQEADPRGFLEPARSGQWRMSVSRNVRQDKRGSNARRVQARFTTCVSPSSQPGAGRLRRLRAEGDADRFRGRAS